MPEENNPENKLRLPPAGSEETSQTAEGRPAPPRRSEPQAGQGGFFSAMALKTAHRKGPDAQAAPPSGLREAAPAKPSPQGWEPEGWESGPPSPPSAEASGEESKDPGPDLTGFFRRIARKTYRGDHVFVALCLTALLAGLLSAVSAWTLGSDSGKRQLIEQQTAADVTMSAGNHERLNKAFDDLRAGRPADALAAFQQVQATNPGVASMAYLTALAAMRSKNFALAEEQAALSILRRERVSDSMAIQALLQIQKSEDPNSRKFGDQMLRAELILRRAALADPANPVPMIELAALLRQQRKFDEAIDLLKAARSRVQPFDLPPFLEAAIVLTTLQNKADPDLPGIGDPEKDLPSGISAAYVSLRRGQFTEAAEILKGIKNRTAPGYFRYLMNDPAIRPFSNQRELRGILQ